MIFIMFLRLTYCPNSQSQRTINYFAYCQIYWVCSKKVCVQVDILFFKNIKHCTQVVVVSRRLWWCPFFCSWKIWRDWYQNCILSEWFKPDEAHNKTRAISFVELFICWTGLIFALSESNFWSRNFDKFIFNIKGSYINFRKMELWNALHFL